MIKINLNRFNELDALRGLAAVSVLMHHFLLVKDSSSQLESDVRILLYPFQNGPAAVVLFFVLSGFVLSLPLWRGVKSGYPRFLMRRIFRIYPPYLFTLAVSVAGAYLFYNDKRNLSHWFQGSWSSPVDPHLVLQHILFIGPSYQASQYNTVFWTLILEMQISLIFPFLLGILKRIPTGWDWLFVGLIWMLGFWGAYLIPLSSICQIAYWSSYFLAGAVLARRVLVFPDLFPGIFAKMPTLAVSLTLLICSTFIGHNKSQTMHLLSYLPCSVGSLGTILSALYNPFFRRVLDTKVAAFLGHISYSLYLIHAVVLNVCFHVLYPSLSFSFIFFPYVVITLILATLMRKVIETPSIQLGAWLTAKNYPQKSLTSILQPSD